MEFHLGIAIMIQAILKFALSMIMLVQDIIEDAFIGKVAILKR